MVTPLRTSLLPFQSRARVDGMFVVNRSNASGMSIPHLPLLNANADGSLLTTCSFGASSEPVRLTCAGFEDAFDDGDVVWIDGRRKLIRSVLAARANANTLLVTERCDNRCAFCSQPPNEKPDADLFQNAALAILNFNTEGYVGISGGEPTLNRDLFIRFLRTLRELGNRTKLHILTNGRSFADADFAKTVHNELGDRPVLWGVPLYGHRSVVHDAQVNAYGAFVDTAGGLLNLCGLGAAVELRIVPTRQNVVWLPEIVRFVVSSYPSIQLISIMNLEPKGWARANYDRLYVRVREQEAALGAAVRTACAAGRQIRLFNYPLCLLSAELRAFAVKSISDWKNYYPDECQDCRLHADCGGFFASATGTFREVIEVQR